MCQMLALISGGQVSKRLIRFIYLGSSPIYAIYFLSRSRLILGVADRNMEETHKPQKSCSYLKPWVICLFILRFFFHYQQCSSNLPLVLFFHNLNFITAHCTVKSGCRLNQPRANTLNSHSGSVSSAVWLGKVVIHPVGPRILQGIICFVIARESDVKL